MGKCLSCCGDSDDDELGRRRAASITIAGKGDSSIAVIKGSKAELSVGGSSTGRSLDGQSSRRDAANQQNNANNTFGSSSRAAIGVSAGLGGSGNLAIDGGGNGNGNGERRSQWRMPPIRSSGNGSGGGGESKRSGGSGGHSRSESSSEAKILLLYEQYRDPREDAILMDGIERLCQDLNVKPEEFKVLVLAWKFGAETMCRFSRQEFVRGCRALRVSSIRGIQGRFGDLLKEVQGDPEQFKDLYRFTFRFGLDSEVGQRILPTDMAVDLWRLVLGQREPPTPLLPRWLAFLERHPHVRGIPRDTWNMFLNFVEAVGDDLSAYDDAEAWPSLFDDFVEYENDQTNQNVQPSRKERKEDGVGPGGDGENGGDGGSDADRA